MKHPVDLYQLTGPELAALPILVKLGDKDAKKVIRGLDRSKSAPLSRLIIGLGIRHVGDQTAISLAAAFRSISALAGALREELEEVDDVGPKVAKSIRSFFCDDTNRSVIDRLRKHGIDPVDSQGPAPTNSDPDGPLFGEVVVFTGALSITRADATELAEAAGCEVAKSVTKKTTLLVVGDVDLQTLSTGRRKTSKHRKAELLALEGQSIRIIAESDFHSIVATAPREGYAG